MGPQFKSVSRHCLGQQNKLVEHAGLVQLVEHLLAKEKVEGSSPLARSGYKDQIAYRKL